MNDNPGYESLEQRFQENVRPGSIERRKDILRNPVHPDLKSALEPDFYQRYLARTRIENPDQIHPGLGEIKKKNPSVQVEEIKGKDGQLDKYVLTAKINDNLSSVTILDPEIKEERETMLTTREGLDKLDKEYSYLVATNTFLLSQDGKVIDLNEYFRKTFRFSSGSKETRIALSGVDSPYFLDRTIRRIVTPPLISLQDIGGFIHEAGHANGADVNSFFTKYSVERDAAAFMMTVSRSLKQGGFLTSDDAKQIIDFQRYCLDEYQKEGESRLHIRYRTLAPETAHNQEAVNHARWLETQRKKPPEERKKWKPKQESLINTYRARSAELIQRNRGLKRKYPEGIDKYSLTGSPTKYYFFQIGSAVYSLGDERSLGEMELNRYDRIDDQTVRITEYSLGGDKMYIETRECDPVNDFSGNLDSVKIAHLVFNDSQPDMSDKDVKRFQGALGEIINFLDVAEKGEVQPYVKGNRKGFIDLLSQQERVAA